MPALRDRVIAHLQQCPDGATDAHVAQALSCPHPQANYHCRRLRAEGRVQRRTVGGVIRSFWVGGGGALIPGPSPMGWEKGEERGETGEGGGRRPWHWEGHVHDRAIEHLRRRGYRIVSAADTATKEAGKDIVAEGSAGPLWVTVKGYPVGTERTRPSTQAGHWFKDALFDMVDWRGRDAVVRLALALPDFPRYRRLARRVAWLQAAARFDILWVAEDGSVTVSDGGG